MGKYLLENIHHQFPNARLGIVVASRGAMIRDLLAGYPWLEVREVNRHNPVALLALIRDFYGSDLVITQYAGKKGGTFSLASKCMARLLAKRKGLIGFADASQWNGALYDQLVPFSTDVAIAEHERAALRTAKLSVPLLFPALTSGADTSALLRFSLETKKYLVVHLFAGNAGRGLSPEKKRELIHQLAGRFPDTTLVVSGGPADRVEAQQASEGLRAMVIAGEASLQEMAQIIKASRGVVSVDTGIAHIAAQLGAPLVVLRTCIGRPWWLPTQYGEQASITVLAHDELCVSGHTYKDYPDCIMSISDEEVTQAVAKWF